MSLHISVFPEKVRTDASGSVDTVMVRFVDGSAEVDVYLYRLSSDDLRAIATAVSDELRKRAPVDVL